MTKKSRSLRHGFQTGAHDPAQASRVLGVLVLTGALLIFLSIVLPHPKGANTAGLLGIVGLGALTGSSSLIWARYMPPWVGHIVLAISTSLISLCVYFSGVASGIYYGMFVWVVLLCATFFPGRAVVVHVGWVVISWGLALLFVEESSGYSTLTRWTLGSLVMMVAAAVLSEIVAGRKSTEEQLQSAQQDLEHLSNHDPLTGVANRRLLKKELAREFARAQRQDWPLSIIALDLDKFKEYNDGHGHLAGDRLLRGATDAWVRILRGEDFIARLGGDEFVAVLPDCRQVVADRVAQRLRSDPLLECECSTGTVSWDGFESAEELLARADKVLYEAKRERFSLSSPA